MSDVDRIEECVERYYASLRGSDPAMVREVFHDNAKITGY
ncbi:MAG: nuclear transport factor 2 family protein, partial [Phycisphaeraceae bacterium]|nr:nuclear transport factor 2 family protein [Phycisphaeraceae bacterium]